MDEQRIEFAHRHEDEPATVHARMRHHEIRFVDDLLAVKQNVQIHSSGARSVLLIASERALDLPEYSQEAFRSDIRFKLHDPIQEPAIARLGMVVYRLGFIEQRHPRELGVRKEAQQRHRTIAEIDSIPDVRPKPNEDCFSSHSLFPPPG